MNYGNFEKVHSVRFLCNRVKEIMVISASTCQEALKTFSHSLCQMFSLQLHKFLPLLPRLSHTDKKYVFHLT